MGMFTDPIRQVMAQRGQQPNFTGHNSGKGGLIQQVRQLQAQRQQLGMAPPRPMIQPPPQMPVQSMPAQESMPASPATMGQNPKLRMYAAALMNRK